MRLRCLFLAEGTSDAGLAGHLERIAVGCGVHLAVTAPDLTRLRPPPGRRVGDRLRAALLLGGEYDLVAIHRDANSAGDAARRGEIGEAMAGIMPGVPHIAVVPVRTTEAWLLLDKHLLRRVAGRQSG